jgi:hypothetical protein
MSRNCTPFERDRERQRLDGPDRLPARSNAGRTSPVVNSPMVDRALQVFGPQGRRNEANRVIPTETEMVAVLVLHGGSRPMV